ncbi:MAG: flagellar hook-basal body complex protein FliE [Lachnospiraceae bacterium]|nr:flagellar hook-basal body complex protein FliE [Lachnospiraceae bacterium]
MDSQFITPIQPMTFGRSGIEAVGKDKRDSLGEVTHSLFQDIFQNAIQNVRDTQADLEDKQYMLATGQIDDAHTLPIAAAKAQLSVDLLVQLRNKALEAYTELMRTSL